MAKFIQITPHKKDPVTINIDEIKEIKPCKVGSFYADFGDPSGPAVNDPGVPGTKITLKDGKSYLTTEGIKAVREKVGASESSNSSEEEE